MVESHSPLTTLPAVAPASVPRWHAGAGTRRRTVQQAGAWSRRGWPRPASRERRVEHLAGPGRPPAGSQVSASQLAIDEGAVGLRPRRVAHLAISERAAFEVAIGVGRRPAPSWRSAGLLQHRSRGVGVEFGEAAADPPRGGSSTSSTTKRNRLSGARIATSRRRLRGGLLACRARGCRSRANHWPAARLGPSAISPISST